MTHLSNYQLSDLQSNTSATVLKCVFPCRHTLTFIKIILNSIISGIFYLIDQIRSVNKLSQLEIKTVIGQTDVRNTKRTKIAEKVIGMQGHKRYK